MRFYKSAAMTANQVTSNLVSGVQEVEWVRRPSLIRLLGTNSLTTGGILATLIAGGVTLLDEVALGGGNRSPIFPDDIIGEWGVPAGAQVVLRLRESLGGTPTYFVALDVVPVQ